MLLFFFLILFLFVFIYLVRKKGKKQGKKKRDFEKSPGEDDGVEMNNAEDHSEHLVARTISSYDADGSETIEIEVVDVVDNQTKPPEEKTYHPDSVYTSIDGLRAIAVFLMVVRTVIARFTYGANPLTKAFGGDWLPPIFLYASGARFVALFLLVLIFVLLFMHVCLFKTRLVVEQQILRDSLDALDDKPVARRRLLWESAIKYYGSTITVCFLHVFIYVDEYEREMHLV